MSDLGFFRITGFRLQPYRLALRDPWRSSSTTLNEREGLLVELQTPDGVGLGDCPPLPGHGTESFPEARGFLKNLREIFPGGPPQMLLAGLRNHMADHPAACYALETACLDLLAQRMKRPLRQFLAPGARSEVPVNAMLGALDDATGERAAAAAAQGYRGAKVKVGLAEPETDIARLRELLSGLPDGLRLRLDVNGAWPAERMPGLLEALADLPLDAIEEPCGTADLAVLEAWQHRVPFPLALDESLHRLNVDRVIDSHAVRRVVIKPVTFASLGWAAKVGRRARGEGIEVVVTSAVESAVGLAAAASVAAAIDAAHPEERPALHGLATGPWLAEDVAEPLPIEHGRLCLPETTGLGVSLKPEA